MLTRPRIAIIYLSYHCDRHIDDVLSAFKKITYPKDKLELVIVDNPHPQYGSSVKFLEENVLPLSDQEIPHVTLLPQTENLGFAGGNNVGAKWALANGFDYVFFHNDDGFLATNALEPLVEAMENDQKIGMAQALLLLHPETDLINSDGNQFQYLGFGFCGGYRKKFSDLKTSAVSEVGYASGAALLVRVDLIAEFGAWDNDFFMYHEDLEWSFRLRTLGYKIVLVKDSVFYHKYQFGRSIDKFYFMDRNRYGVMLMYYKLLTLLLLLPMLLVLEIGLWVFAFKGGWAKKRVGVYQYWLKWGNWKIWLAKRKIIQARRKINDRVLLSYSVSTIEFQEKFMANPLLKYIGNPMMKLYYWIVVKGVIRW